MRVLTHLIRFTFAFSGNFLHCQDPDVQIRSETRHSESEAIASRKTQCVQGRSGLRRSSAPLGNRPFQWRLLQKHSPRSAQIGKPPDLRVTGL